MRKVSYRTDFPTINLKPLLLDRNVDQLLDHFCTKSEAWSYEQEWRAFHANKKTAYHYPADCLTGIYLGPEISSESLEIVCLILGGQNEKVKLWRGSRSKTEFKVDFEEFTYTSYIEAKRQGLR